MVSGDMEAKRRDVKPDRADRVRVERRVRPLVVLGSMNTPIDPERGKKHERYSVDDKCKQAKAECAFPMPETDEPQDYAKQEADYCAVCNLNDFYPDH